VAWAKRQQPGDPRCGLASGDPSDHEVCVTRPAPTYEMGFRLFKSHGGDFTRSGKRPKTYHRFLGTIFLEGAFQWKLLAGNGLRNENARKGEKSRKKCQFFGWQPSFSCQTGSFQGHFQRWFLAQPESGNWNSTQGPSAADAVTKIELPRKFTKNTKNEEYKSLSL
jgi:hypothetical protein